MDKDKDMSRRRFLKMAALTGAAMGSVVILGGLPFATSPLCIHLC